MKALLKSTACTVILTGLWLAATTIANADDTPSAVGATAAPVTTAPEQVATCRGCHGIAGYRTAFPLVYSVPKLGGQQAAYIVKALQDYRAGLRAHATMQSIAATLTNEQITAIAAYYAGTQK
jgi:cytochrome c553